MTLRRARIGSMLLEQPRCDGQCFEEPEGQRSGLELGEVRRECLFFGYLFSAMDVWEGSDGHYRAQLRFWL